MWIAFLVVLTINLILTPTIIITEGKPEFVGENHIGPIMIMIVFGIMAMIILGFAIRSAKRKKINRKEKTLKRKEIKCVVCEDRATKILVDRQTNTLSVCGKHYMKMIGVGE